MAGPIGPNGPQQPPKLNQATRAGVRVAAGIPGLLGDVNKDQNGKLKYDPNNPNQLGRYFDSVGDNIADTINNPKKLLPPVIGPWSQLFK